MKNKFVLSVIIPTRNRAKYAEAAIRHILKLSSEIQIIVCDNSDDPGLKEKISDITILEQLEYHYIPERIAAIDNYNYAAGFAKGEYFCAIGDDDTLLPNIIECIEWMRKNDLDVVKPSKNLTYFWPNYNNSSSKSALVWADKFDALVKQYNPRDGVIELLENGGQDYQDLPLIGSYHCIVRTACMNKVYELTGRYYGGCSPDMYSAVCLSLLPNIKAVGINYPVTLPGVCSSSTSAASNEGKHIGKLEDAPHFIGLKEPYKWDQRIPYLYSVETIWCETMFKALDAMQADSLIEVHFDRSKLINAIVNNNKDELNIVKQYLSSEDKKLVVDNNVKKNKNNNYVIARVKYLYALLRGQTLRRENCLNIEEAANYVEEYLNKNYNQVWKEILDTSL